MPVADPLAAAEAIDHYRAACEANEANRAARTGNIYELDTISPKKTTFLQRLCGKFPLLSSAEIAILNSSADGGLPHTRPPALICLPHNQIPNSETPQFVETLLHEGIHIHQRLFPPLWLQAIRRAGWKEVAAERIPAEFRARVRLNPDTIAAPYWAWNTYHVPLPLFPKGLSIPSLSSATTQWLDLRTNTLFHDPPTSFSNLYKESGAEAEHPFELYAYIFSRRGLKTTEDIEQALREI